MWPPTFARLSGSPVRTGLPSNAKIAVCNRLHRSAGHAGDPRLGVEQDSVLNKEDDMSAKSELIAPIADHGLLKDHRLARAKIVGEEVDELQQG